jgi:ornithine cyclodeaminase/alanine dehydrogenase-like protein (mu-crystallin family)
MRFHDAAAVRAALPMPELLDAVEDAYRAVVADRDRSPLRTHVSLPNGDLLVMPGVVDDAAGRTVKVVTVVPENAGAGLPTVQAVVLWLDATTGTPLAMLEGATLTAMRTGAASGVATRLLARRNATTLAVIGAGAQAPWQVRAVCAVRPIRTVQIHAPSPTRREALAASLAEELGPAVTVAATASAQDVLRDADVVCCATTASQPVFEAGWIQPGTHVNGVGAFRLGMVELPAGLFARASLVAIDERGAAQGEAGDVMAAVEAGAIGMEHLVEIGEVAPDWAATRDPAAITVFKSVGLAVQDVAAATVAMRHLGSA